MGNEKEKKQSENSSSVLDSLDLAVLQPYPKHFPDSAKTKYSGLKPPPFKVERAAVIQSPLSRVLDTDSTPQSTSLPLNAKAEMKRKKQKEADARDLRRMREFNVNTYTAKKTAAKGMLDIALLMSNAIQLKRVIHSHGAFEYYWFVLVLLCISVTLQVAVGLALLHLGASRIPSPFPPCPNGTVCWKRVRVVAAEVAKDDVERARETVRMDRMNDLVTAIILVLVVVNIFIAVFGIMDEGEKTKP